MEVLEEEIRRREQIEALHEAAGSWRDDDHPELTAGAETWVRQMRDASLERLQQIERNRDAG
jgi:hypothetical protein